MAELGKRVGISLIGTITVAGITMVCVGNSNSNAVILKKAIDDTIKKNPYIQMMVGPEQYVYLAYNEDGECIAQSDSGGIGFYLKDNQMVTVSDTEVVKDYDISTLHFIKYAVDVADTIGENGEIEKDDIEVDSDGNRVEDIDNTDKADEYDLYTIKIRGKENIRKIYENVNTEFADGYMEMMFSGFEDTDNNNVELGIRVSTTSDGGLGAVCETSYDGELYTNWIFGEYKPAIDWEFGKDWYTTDVSEYDKWVDMVTSKVTEVSNGILGYFQENGMIEDNTRTGKIDYNTFSTMDIGDRLVVIKDVLSDLSDLNATVNISADEYLKKIDEYYSTVSNRGVNVLQASINVGVADGIISVDNILGYPESGE